MKKFLKKLSIPQNKQNLDLDRKFFYSQIIIKAFYASIFIFCLQELSYYTAYLEIQNIIPIWPVKWLDFVPLTHGIALILLFYLASTFAALILSEYKLIRILVFIALLEVVAFKNSFSLIGHSEHLSIFLSFMLIFLPSKWHSFNKVNKSTQIETLIVFSGCQAFILLTYTMSGIGKLITALTQFLAGEIHVLAPQGLAMTIAARLLSTDSTTYLGEWLIENYYFAWLLMLGTVYWQFFSLFILFLPSLHQLWACGLILIHVGIFFAIKISFWENCLWLTLFMLYSPFRPKYFNLKQTLRDLPLFGLLLAKI